MTARVLVPGLALVLVVLSGHATPGQDRPRPGRPAAADAAPVMQIHVFTLQHTDAAEMLQTLKDLFIGDDAKKIRLTLHRSTNSLVAMATEPDLERVGGIIAKLETTAADRKKAAGKELRSAALIEQAQLKLAQLQAEVEQMRERAAWAERMFKLNYMSAAQADAERIRLQDLRLKLQAAEAELASLQAAPARPEEKPKAAAGAVWEYMVMDRQGILEEQLNKMGADGWELTEVIPRTAGANITGHSLVFKRPKR